MTFLISLHECEYSTLKRRLVLEARAALSATPIVKSRDAP